MLYPSYTDKNIFIRDLINECRFVKRRCRNSVRGYTPIVVGDESWAVSIYVENGRICTELTWYGSSGRQCHYPKTVWGNEFKRWDSELREFLIREVQKV